MLVGQLGLRARLGLLGQGGDLPLHPVRTKEELNPFDEQALTIASLARQDDEELGAHAREAVAQHADQHLALARIGHDRLDNGAHLVQLRRSWLVPLAAAVGQHVVKLEVRRERVCLEVVDLVGEGKEQAVLVKRIDLVLVCGEVLQDQVCHVLVLPVSIGRKALGCLTHQLLEPLILLHLLSAGESRIVLDRSAPIAVLGEQILVQVPDGAHG